jgi:hypothetical protein
MLDEAYACSFCTIVGRYAIIIIIVDAITVMIIAIRIVVWFIYFSINIFYQYI